MKYLITIFSLLFSSLLWAQDVNMQNATVNQCGGVFYDSGGEFGNYSNDEDLVLTICPENAGQKIQLDFVTFVTQLGATPDVMSIFNGDSVAAPPFGDFSGTNSPGLVQATQDNTSGCITIQFVSNADGNIDGWVANISCLTPCQVINSQIDSASPAPNADNYIRVCPNEEITLTGSGVFSIDGTGATYEWDLGDGNTASGQTATFSYPDPGVYIVNLNIRDANTSIDPLGCENDNLINQVIQVATEADFTGTQATLDTLCFGDSTDITGEVEAVEFVNDCTPPVSGITFLPDGNGVTYETSVRVDCYDSAQTLTDISQLLSICLTMEHSFLGDLDIEIISPSGQVVRMHDQGGGSANLGIPWATGTIDGQSGNTTPGQGIQYCFVPNGGFPTLVGGIQAGGVFPNGDGPGTYSDSFVPAGTYSSVNPLDGLLGSPLNGDWTIRVVDNIGADNGHIFAWSIEFDPNLQPPELSFTPVITSEAWDADPTIINTVGNVITVQPTTAGQFCYTYRVTDDFGCEYTEEVCIDVLPELITEIPNNLVVCDTGLPPYFFDLDSNTAVVLASAPNISDLRVTYHNSLADADADTGEIVDISNYAGTDGETIFIRVEYQDSGCYEVLSFTLNVSDQPTINPVSDLELCDDASNDGAEEFDLSLQTLGILGTQASSDFTVTYHLSFADADAGIGALPNLYTNVTNPEPIFVRIESSGNSSCYNASATPVFNLIVNTRAIANTPSNLEVCDDGSIDGLATFDLSTQLFDILAGQDPAVFTVSFHGSQADADANAAALPTSYTNTIPNLETVYVRVEDPLYPDCYGTTSFDLIVNPLPTLVAPTPLEVCDDGTPDGLTEMDLSLKNPEITGGNPNYAVSYYLTLADAETETNPLPTLYTNTSNGQIISVRVEDINTGCYDTTTLELIVQQAPVAFIPQPLRYCDPDNDGFGVFTLSDADNEITGGAAGLTVSYHETLVNAQNNVDAIDTSVSYNNIVVNTQTLYVRVESATITTDCATLVELQLVVEPTPQLIDPTPLEECDDISADGFASFDLTSKADEILNGQDPAQYILSYYETQVNADTANNPIANPIAYTNTNPLTQIIWIRVEDNTTVEGCYKITSLELIVNPLPVLVTPAPLTLCDVNTPGDEQEAFTLEDADDEILNGQTGITLSYYETQLDADNGTSPIVSPYVNTISNPQTIFVRAENDVTGCSNTVTVTLRVNPIPSPEPSPEAIEVCDDDNDGFAEFDLEQRTVAITNGELDVIITYHETQDEAQQGDNPITGLYTNIVANNQMIYVRSENTLTGCYSLTLNTLELIVQPSPEVPTALTDYVLCDTDANGITQFDLTTKDDEILNGQNPTAVTLSYHVSAADAASGNNPIINTGNYTNTTNPQVIYVRLFNPTTGCQDTGTFELQVELPPVAVQPTQLSVCDDLGEVPGDEITVFDLTVKDTEITGGNASWSVAYYETSADAQAQTNVIPDPTQYTNTAINGLQANPQTLYAVVTDTDTGCTDQTTLTIRVLPNPTPTPSDQLPDLELCDDMNTGDGQEVFDLTQNEILVLNGETGVTASYHETAEDADANTNAIVDPTQYTNTEAGGQEIYVRVTNDVTGCYALVNFTVIVYPLPEVVAVTDFIQCELNTDGIDSFDLTTKDEEVLNGQDPTQYIVSYHASLTDAEAGINGLVSPYTNQTNPQQIFVTITNNQTGCSISTQSFNIEVQEAAQANPDLNPIVYEECDDNMETDGDTSNDTIQFDLTTQDADVLDGQDPANYIVTYFATEADANLNVNPLPTLYENISNPQVIYARVDNDTPDTTTGADSSICYALAPLTLQVNPLPEFDLEDSYTLCINTNGTEILDPLVIDTGLSTANYSFEWSYNGTVLPIETGSSIAPTQGGTYSVMVTDISTSQVTSCLNADSTEVIESEPPVLEVNLVTQAFADNHVIEAIATAVGGSTSEYEYSLDGGPWQDSGTFENVSAGEHEITARDKFGCGITTETIFVIDYPLYFTPNGDGNNDTWAIEGIGSTAKIYIFDRYGKLLKQLSPTGSGWDGTYNGNIMPSNDYWFTVEYTEPSTNELKEFRAHFALKR